MARRLFRGKYPISKGTKYVVEYIFDYNPARPIPAYYRLVRVRDDEILFAFEDLDKVLIEAWKADIPYKTVTII